MCLCIKMIAEIEVCDITAQEGLTINTIHLRAHLMLNNKNSTQKHSCPP